MQSEWMHFAGQVHQNILSLENIFLKLIYKELSKIFVLTKLYLEDHITSIISYYCSVIKYVFE